MELFHESLKPYRKFIFDDSQPPDEVLLTETAFVDMLLRSTPRTNILERFSVFKPFVHTSGPPGMIVETADARDGSSYMLKMKLLPVVSVEAMKTEHLKRRWGVISLCFGEIVALELISKVFGHLKHTPAMCLATPSFLVLLRNFSDTQVAGSKSVIEWFEARRRAFLTQTPYPSDSALFGVTTTQALNEIRVSCMVLPKMTSTLGLLLLSRDIQFFESPGAFLSSVVLHIACTLHILQTELGFMHCDLHVSNIFLNIVKHATSAADNMYSRFVPWKDAPEMNLLLERVKVSSPSGNGVACVLPVMADYDASIVASTYYNVVTIGSSEKFQAQSPFPVPPTAFNSGKRMHPMLDLWKLSYSIVNHIARHCPSLFLESLEVASQGANINERMQRGASTRADDMHAFLRLLIVILSRGTAFLPFKCGIDSAIMRTLQNKDALLKRFPPTAVQDGAYFFSGESIATMQAECLSVLRHFTGTVAEPGIQALQYQPVFYDFIKDTTHLLYLACTPSSYSYAGDKSPATILLHSAATETGVLQVGTGPISIKSGRILSALHSVGYAPPESTVLKLNNPQLRVFQFNEIQKYYTDTQRIDPSRP